jgi:hypothetical protein
MTEILTRLHELNATDLTVRQVSYALGRSEPFVCGLIAAGRLETVELHSTSNHRWDSGLGKDKAPGQTRKQPKGYLILRDAVLIYLVKSTKGGREVILHAIEESFPRSAKLCRKVAESLDAPAPENVFPMPAGQGARKAKLPAENPAQLFLFTA